MCTKIPKVGVRGGFYLIAWPRLFKRWIVLSTGQITIQWISIRKTNCTLIQWIEIYPMDSAIHLSSNWGLVYNKFVMSKFLLNTH